MIHQYQPGTNPAAPTLLMLHGTGGNEHDLLGLAADLLPEAGVLSPRGNVLEHGMPRFFRRIAEGVFDLEDLRLRTSELADFVQEASAQYRFDATGVVAVGLSNGANIAASLLLLTPGVLAGAVLLRAMVPIVPDPLPALKGTSVLLSSGERDTLVADVEAERLAALLRQAGADVSLVWQDAGHRLVRADVTAAQAWLRARFLPSTP